MILDERNCKNKINGFTYQDWQPLMALIPEIENTSNFGEWSGGNKDEEGVVQIPYCVQATIVSQFIEIVYAIPIIIDFDWGAWDEGYNTPQKLDKGIRWMLACHIKKERRYGKEHSENPRQRF